MTCQLAGRVTPEAILPIDWGLAPETRLNPGGRFTVTLTACAVSWPVSVMSAVMVNGVPISAVAGPDSATDSDGGTIAAVPAGTAIA